MRSRVGDPAFTLTFNPDAAPSAPLATLSGLTANLTALTANGLMPVVSLAPVELTHGGRIGFTGQAGGNDVTVILPDGYANSIGVAGVLPLSVSQVGIAFANRSDLRQATGAVVRVTGAFQAQQFVAGLGFTPTFRVGT